VFRYRLINVLEVLEPNGDDGQDFCAVLIVDA